MARTYESIDELLGDVFVLVEDNREQLSLVAAKAAEATLKERVFNNGLDVNGARIGTYSTNPSSFGVSAFAVKSKFKPNPNRRSVFVPDGYSGLRQLNGRQNAYVDLQYTGSLIRSIVVQSVGNQLHALVFQNDEEETIGRANEERFDKTIFAAGDAEMEAMETAVSVELDVLFTETFGS